MESHSKNQGGILSKMEMSYVTDLPEGILIKFLQNLNPEDVQSFCTNERILKLCQNDTTLKQLLIDAFTTTIIGKYSPLEPYLHSDVYISKVNERLRKVIDEIEMFINLDNINKEKKEDTIIIINNKKINCILHRKDNGHLNLT